MSKTQISSILRSAKTVFTFTDILLASGETNAALMRRRLSYYIKTQQLHSIRRGLYAKDTNYDIYELATKIYTPAYISFETVLGAAGVTFQYYSQIFVASYKTVEIQCDNQKYSFKTLKSSILTNSAGIEHRQNYAIASPERAFLDVVYLNKNYHFDHLSGLDWEKVYDILPVYGGNTQMAKRVKIYHDAVKQNLL